MEGAPLVRCRRCNWVGEEYDLDGKLEPHGEWLFYCPSCGSGEIEDYQPEPPDYDG